MYSLRDALSVVPEAYTTMKARGSGIDEFKSSELKVRLTIRVRRFRTINRGDWSGNEFDVIGHFA